MQHNTWLFDWLDEWGLRSTDEVRKALSRSKPWESLLLHAHGQEESPKYVGSLGPRSVVAGRSLDLTAFLACAHPDCMTGQVDQLFSHVWHYFDKIAVVGPDSHLFLEMGSSANARASMTNMVLVQSQVLFHVRSTGLEELLVFVAKPPSCIVHWPQLEEIADLQLPLELGDELASVLLTQGRTSLERNHRGEQEIVLAHPDLTFGKYGQSLERLRHYQKKADTLELTLAKDVIRRHYLAAASDLYAAEQLGLPLGAGVPLETRLLQTIRPISASVDEVAFSLRLPVVEGLDARDLMALRNDEQDAFDIFRSSLRSAISERVRASPTSDSVKLAREVQLDVIEPALATIERRLDAAGRLLNKKNGVNVGLAGLSTVCGLVGMPEVAAGVLLAAGGSGVTSGFKYFEDTRDVSLDGMYFLWRVKRHAETRKGSGRKRSKRTQAT
jgi:hypothetical protein